MANASPVLNARSIRNADVAYESRDLSHRAVFYFLLVLAVGLFFAYLIMWGMFNELGKEQYAGHQTTNPIMTSDEELKEIGGDPANSFPMPHLQPDDIADLNKFRIREEQRLNTYGWADEEHSRIRIPIETAIDMMARSWPAAQQTASSEVDESASGISLSGANQNPKPVSDDRGGNYGW